MSDTRTVKKIFNWKPLTKRSQGHVPNEDQKFDSLRTGSKEMENGGR
jgi:hypothetical protein